MMRCIINKFPLTETSELSLKLCIYITMIYYDQGGFFSLVSHPFDPVGLDSVVGSPVLAIVNE